MDTAVTTAVMTAVMTAGMMDTAGTDLAPLAARAPVTAPAIAVMTATDRMPR